MPDAASQTAPDVEEGGHTGPVVSRQGPEKSRHKFGWRKFSFARRLFFFDVDPLVYHGYRTRLEQEDMWHERTLATSYLLDVFEPALQMQQVRQEAELKKVRKQLQALDAQLIKEGKLSPADALPESPVKGAPASATHQLPAVANGNGHAATNGAANGMANGTANGTAHKAANGTGPPAAGPPGKGGPPGAGPPGKKEKKPKLPKDLQKRADLQKRYDFLSTTVDLRRVVWAGNVKAFLGTAVLYLLAQACSLAGPLLLQRIVQGLQCRGPACAPRTELYYYCIGLFLAPFIQAICENHQTFILYRTGTRMRNALMAQIYRKCLRLSNSSLQEESTGRVVTLMSNDAQKLQDFMMAIHALWGSPCYIIAVLALLWQQVGWATLVGLGVMLLLAPASGKLATKLGQLRRSILQWTDKRVGYMNEVISGIQMIKFYAWEKPFEDKVESARSQEAKILRTTAAWQGVFGMVLFSGPVLVAIFCFGSWTIAGNELSNAQAYTALALFALLRFPMSFLPMLITMVVNALVALKRIGAFLNKEESQLGKEVFDSDFATGEVMIEQGEFTWDAHEPRSTLTDINLTAKPGSLTMIVGGVGSGKSSVLGALVGHMTKRHGRIKMGGKVAYVAQSAWIMNDTLQENVLLGDEIMNPDRYKMALKVSCMGPDLELLPNGDLTEIGDRGVTLSGGQKQRVSIARAVYSDADVYLLDDPLSAVDSHVGRSLFEDCIRGPLKDKTVILVTNALQYLPQADNILWMDNGRIKAQGTYPQLVAAGLNIAELAHLDDEDESEDEEEEERAKKQREAAEQAGVRPELVELIEAERTRSKEVRRGSKEVRRVSKDLGSKITLTRGAAGANRNLTGVEEREAGNISGDVIKRYVLAGGGLPVLVTLVVLYGLEQGARVYTDRWVGIWSSNVFNQPLAFYLGIYFAMGVVYGLITFARSLRFLFMCVNAAVSLHNQLLDHILSLPKAFFDTNPAGRILNRFSRDTDIMDSTLPQSLIQFIGCVATYVSILIVISIATKWFAIALPPLTVVYFVIQRYYIPTARELQRLESISRSPIYSRFQEALLGVTTIRAYRKEAHFTKVSDALMEFNADAFLTQRLAAAWLAMRLDLLGLGILTGCGALLIQGNVDPGLAGLALSYALDLTRFLKQGTNMASKSEADFNSVERIVQYLRPEPEAASDTPPDVKKDLPPNWPNHGAIHVLDVTMRYRPGMPLVLKGVTFDIAGGEKVGLVGRTGSGKSSIFLTLFRMVEVTSGQIMIDGVDIRRLGVRHLRSKMSIIPQDPFMFSGTVRNNLDPFEQNPDNRLWEVLEAVGLKEAIKNLNGGLTAKVVDNGANFSLGQRQLFCMARAMLRDSKILMLDEATASVDIDTDALIQSAIRTVFTSCTLLTIAHRLNTIIDSDKVVVLDAGKVAECGHADDLLKRDNSLFSGMVSQTGKSSARYLRWLASSSRASRTTGLKSLGNMPRVLSLGNVSTGSPKFDRSSFDSVSENPLFKEQSPSRLKNRTTTEFTPNEEERDPDAEQAAAEARSDPATPRSPRHAASEGGATPLRVKLLQQRAASPIGRSPRATQSPLSGTPHTASPMARSPRAGSSSTSQGSPGTGQLSDGTPPLVVSAVPLQVAEQEAQSARSHSTPGGSPLGTPERARTPRSGTAATPFVKSNVQG